MIVSASLVKAFPEISIWICDNLPKVRKDPKLFRAFQKYARMDETVAERAIRHGTPPNIDWRFMPTDNGQYDRKYPTFVFISQEICRRFRDASSTDRAGMAVLIESTLLHEMVHWGNALDGKENPYGEMGKAFEKEAYGKDIRAPWSLAP